MLKTLIIVLKFVISLVAIFALLNMVASEDYQYICFPLAILTIALFDGVSYCIKDNNTVYGNANYYSGYDALYSTCPDKHHHGYSYHSSSLLDSKDVEEKAAKAVKRGVKITIEEIKK